jgi:hypothetical protein
MSVRRLSAVVILMASLAPAAVSAAQSPSTGSGPAFDTPLRERILDLGPSPYGGHVKLTCEYFPSFLVKQLDVGAEGAAWFGIVPSRAGHPALCTKTHPPTEKTISGKEWCGYVQGVKQHYVFLNACNAYNGAQDFAVYDAETGKKVFQDSAVDSVNLANATDGGLLLRYARVVVFDCTLPAEQAACWNKIETKLGLENASTPACTAYEKQKGSVIAYPVEVALTASPAVRAMPGEIRCWPPE